MKNYEPAMVDIVMGILGLCGTNKRESWPMLKVYEAFYNMWKENNEPFRELYFSIRGGHPYSKGLEETFFQLGTARLLEVRNPQYSCVLISEQSKMRIKDYLTKVLSEENFQRVSKLSEKFREQMDKILTQEDARICNL